jgi:Zn-dependent peptidase ImmA (M78 family)
MSFLSNETQRKLVKFVQFVVKTIEIENTPRVKIINGRKNGIKTTALYDYTQEKKVIKVNGKNRALVDIMRSIAHELVHHKQFEEGRLIGKIQDVGGEIEDQANAVAGQLIKLFGRKDPTIFDGI